MVYQKLVRDRIPQIIEENGGKAEIRILSDEEYRSYLEAKLDEETQEYHRDKNVEELADILEVVYALAEAIGSDKDALMAAYQKKHDARGGFEKKILLIASENGL